MIKCDSCKEVFSDSELEDGSVNYVPFHDDYVVESKNYRCPYCGSEDVREVAVHSCASCGIVCAEEDMKFSFALGWICEDCIEENEL